MTQEFVPKIFSDTKVGHFTMQSILGLSMLEGPDDDGGLNTFEYGFLCSAMTSRIVSRCQAWIKSFPWPSFPAKPN